MVQWFIRFPEFAEFSEFLLNLEKTLQILLYRWSTAQQEGNWHFSLKTFYHYPQPEVYKSKNILM